MSAPASLGGRIARAVVLWLVLVLTLLLTATVARVTYGGGPEVERVGTASVRSCTEHGPVSLSGIGTVYTCTAQVRWSDGDTETREFPAGQLGPADMGTPVPVYLDIGEGRGEGPVVGRNGSARFAELELPAVLLFGFLALALGIGALYATYRVLRPERGDATRPGTRSKDRGDKDWKVSRTEVEAVPAPRIARRLRLLGVWCLLVVVLAPLSTVPRFDAERAERFTSPWPQVERALLVDPPPAAAVILGLVLAVLLFALAPVVRQDAAKVVKYGPAYVGRNLQGREPVEQRVAERMQAMAANRSTSRVLAVVPGLVLLGLAGWATMRAIEAAPEAAPLPVWLACLRDAVLLACLGVIVLSTTESRYQRLSRLLELHRDSNSTQAGTAAGRSAS
ncbi:DUF6346 domain-containing protein [Prauserella muralis]|uniref:Uncharacterized protein n=1 Tax=Prauserella muralis TaxID=588067 RepID=A0A2V4B310_9PSEU|nr:DUF6346 domain-containing protein [Prauserella muralis]PXY27535.1 hypothetical protein BAY60_14070 [Prauserella muralis]TWE22742.1 hypothetical protein FHX69_3993 [Prauserella muralis]